VIHKWLMTGVALALAAPLVSAGQPPQTPPPTSPPPQSQAPDRGRPTQITDEVPLFNFADYFVGKWNFEWEVPEGLLGAAGTLKGTITYKQLDGPFYEAVTSGSGPGGPFTIRETIGYRAEGKTISRWINDSRGFSFLQVAPVGGDLGGTYNLYYESAPFTVKGKTVRVKNAIRMTSPVRYRNQMSVSADGVTYVNYGNPWFEKDAAATGQK
jgi:hypothetical protein